MEAEQIAKRLLAFEGSDDLGNGDFTVCREAAAYITDLEAQLAARDAILADAIVWDGYDEEGVPAVWLDKALTVLETAHIERKPHDH